MSSGVVVQFNYTSRTDRFYKINKMKGLIVMGESLGKLVEQMFELRKEKEAIKQREREINKLLDELSMKAIQMMETQGIDSLRVPSGTVTRSVALYPSVADKQAFINFCVANDRPDLMVVSANRGTFKEYFEQYNEYPDGLDAYEKATLNFRRAR